MPCPDIWEKLVVDVVHICFYNNQLSACKKKLKLGRVPQEGVELVGFASVIFCAGVARGFIFEQDRLADFY